MHHKKRYRKLQAAAVLYTYNFSEETRRDEPDTWAYSWYPNLHDSLELVLIQDGVVHWTIGGREYHPKPGDILVVNPFELHASRMTASEGSATYYLLYMELSSFRHSLGSDGAEVLQHILSGEESFLEYIKAGDDTALAEEIRLFHRLFIMQDDTPAGLCRMQASLFSILGHLMDMRHPTERSGCDKQRYVFINEVEKYTSQHFSEDISTDQIAEAMNYSAAHFRRVFKECFGTGFQRYLRSWRIRYAACALHNNGLSISEIAEQAGFRDYNYFSRAFKQETGLRPTEWYARRRRAQGQVPFTTE
ncbi:MAG: helix-turn-helix transcriptional regulator [Clostridia bacterium]|nr:helix-turn-helix transcriptional regulator [Clostridia bacterium]